MTDSTPVSLLAGSQTALAELTCPAGTVATSGTAGLAPSGSPTSVPLTPTISNPLWVAAIPTEHPDCLHSTCLLQLFEVNPAPLHSCGSLAVACPDWYTDPGRSGNYECHWGPYVVTLDHCSVFRTPGQVKPNATIGNNGQTNYITWPALELDTVTVATASTQLVQRYDNDTNTACKALGEAIRTDRSAAALVTIPDVVEICQDYDLRHALQWIADTDEADLAVTALVDAASQGEKLYNFNPDCDELNAVGDCLEWSSDYSDLRTPGFTPDPPAAASSAYTAPLANCLNEQARNELKAKCRIRATTWPPSTGRTGRSSSRSSTTSTSIWRCRTTRLPGTSGTCRTGGHTRRNTTIGS